MEIKPIKNDADYQAALEEIERLFAAAPDTPDGDRLEVLTTLVEAYEEKHYNIPMPDPIEAILYHMESRGLSRRDLEPYIGSRARVSEVLTINNGNDPKPSYRARHAGRSPYTALSYVQRRSLNSRHAVKQHTRGTE